MATLAALLLLLASAASQDPSPMADDPVDNAPYTIHDGAVQGRGVFATRNLRSGRQLGVVTTADLPSNPTRFGLSLNHAYYPNAHLYRDAGGNTVVVLHKDVKAGEEIVINYDCNPKQFLPAHGRWMSKEKRGESYKLAEACEFANYDHWKNPETFYESFTGMKLGSHTPREKLMEKVFHEEFPEKLSKYFNINGETREAYRNMIAAMSYNGRKPYIPGSVEDD